MENLLNAANFYLDKGLSIIPCQLRFEKNSAGKEKCKKPAMVDWTKYQKKPVSKLQFLKWKSMFVDKPGRGMAIITGKVSNLLVVDIDSQSSFDNLQKYLKNVKTVIVRTPGGGWHYYFKYRDGFGNRAKIDQDGLDIRAEGGYVIAPPSLYPDGKPYFFEEQHKFTGPEVVAPIPEDLYQHIAKLIKNRPTSADKKRTGKSTSPKSNDKWLDKLVANGIREGSRVTELVRVVGLLKRKLVSDVLIESVVRTINEKCDPPLTEKELLGEVLESIERINDPDKEKTMKIFNNKFRYVEIGPKFSITEFKTKIDDITKMPVRILDIKTPNTLIARYMNRPIVINKAMVNPFSYWMGHKDRIDAEEIKFEPNEKPLEYQKDGKRFLNLWTGLHIEPREGSWKLFHDHIFQSICESDPVRHKWLLQWVARLFQNPGGERPGKVPVFRGGQGTGKGTFVNTLGRVLGLNYGYFTVGRAEHVLGRFNDDMKTALLIHIDEGTYGGNKNDAGHLKHLISEPTRRVEPKGVQTFHIKNHLNIMISSNMDWVIPATRGERRFCIFDINEKFIQNEKYFSALNKELNNGGVEAFLYDMLRFKYTMAELRRVPRTSGTRDQILRGENNVIQFWHTILYKGCFFDDFGKWQDSVVTKDFYDLYKAFVLEGNFRGEVDLLVQFGKKMNKAFGNVLKNTTKKNKEGRLSNAKRFQSLKKCREQFEEVIFGNIENAYWPEEILQISDKNIPF